MTPEFLGPCGADRWSAFVSLMGSFPHQYSVVVVTRRYTSDWGYLLGWGVHRGHESFDYLGCPLGGRQAPFESGGPGKTLALARITVVDRR
jgi:hypothetical protein